MVLTGNNVSLGYALMEQIGNSVADKKIKGEILINFNISPFCFYPRQENLS
jgi:hypothetical protein